MKPEQEVHLTAALRSLRQAEFDLLAAGKGLAAMRLGALISEVSSASEAQR